MSIVLLACSKKDHPAPTPPDEPEVVTPDDKMDEAGSDIIIDYAVKQGNVMQIEKATVHSTTSPLPGEKSKLWLKNLHHKILRTWIQLRYVYNKGSINYNYKYQDSNVPVKDALQFYSQCADSLLIVLSAYNPTQAWPLPQGENFKDFVKQTLIYYKTKYPRIKYIQVGNEPDAADETMATYYPVYKYYYRALNEANDALNLGNNRMLISNGAFTSNVPNMLVYADTFFKSYADDNDPAKKFDFFTFHSYGETNRPLELLDARKSIDNAMKKYNLPVIPVFVTEYGTTGGSDLPSGMTEENMVTMQPAGQLTKAFYLYEGGIDYVFNWSIYHGSLKYKSQLADLENAYTYPYGNAMLCSKEISDRKTRIKAESKKISSLGLGTHVLASASDDKGMAILVWNFNWRDELADNRLKVLVKNIPAAYGQKIYSSIYIIDSKNNNYFNNRNQTTLTPTREDVYDYKNFLSIPLQLDKNSVAMILLKKNP